MDDCLKALGNDKHTGPSRALVQELKDEILRVIGKSPVLAAARDDVKTELDAEFLEAWRFYSDGPDAEVTQWLRVGAPAGILRHSLGARLGGLSPARGEATRRSCSHLLSTGLE